MISCFGLALSPRKVPNGQTFLTSLPQSWAPRQRDVLREPVAKVVVERADIGRIGESDAVSHTLHKARKTRVRIVGMGGFCQL